MFIGRFVAELSNGKQVVEKFPNESKEENARGALHMGWNRLKEHCGKRRLKIVKLGIRFRNFSHYAPDGAEDYFVNMQQQTVLGLDPTFYRGLGFKKDKHWFIVWFDPKGVVCNMEVRPV